MAALGAMVLILPVSSTHSPNAFDGVYSPPHVGSPLFFQLLNPPSISRG